MTDEEEEELYRALAFADGEGQLSPGDHARLMASIDRLRAALGALVDEPPCCYHYEIDSEGGWDCGYCRGHGYHAPDCPWLAARLALGLAPPAPQT